MLSLQEYTIIELKTFKNKRLSKKLIKIKIDKNRNRKNWEIQ